jgi:preprotein translocase subunit SecY
MQLSPKKMADDMMKLNIYIANIRPGKATIEYISFVINKSIFWGSLYRIILCILPMTVQEILLPNEILRVNGTSLLIVTTIIMEILNNIDNLFIKNKYLNYNKFFYVYK